MQMKAAVALVLLLALRAGPAAAYSDKVRAPGYDGRYYPGLEELMGDKGSPEAIFERGCVFIHSSGNLLLHMSNGGWLGDFFGRFCSRPSAEWPPGSNNEYLFMAGLWVGAVDAEGNPHVSTGAYDTEFLPAFDDPRDRIYTSFEGQRGGARFSATGDATSADDDGDASGLDDLSHINEDFFNGKDDDGDGRIDEDFEAISQQMFSCEYTDYGEASTEFFAEHVPLFLRVQQRSFSYSSGGAENMIGVDYKIWNDGTRPLRDIYMGFFVDSDVGPADNDEYPNMYLDDVVGFAEIETTITDIRQSTPANCRRSKVKLQLAFMRDLPDAGLSGLIKTGDVPGWFGGLFLGHSIDPTGLVAPADVGIRTFVWFAQGGSIRDPENDFERYELLSRSSRTDEGIFIQDPPRDPRDYRYVMAVGPFSELLPDTFLTFQVAFVIGEGFEGQNGLKTNAINAQRIFDGDFFNLDGNALTGREGREKCVFCNTGGPVNTIDDDCDPSNAEVQCERGTCTWIDGDCDNEAHLCTGANGKETRVNWIGVAPPPAPLIGIATSGQVTGVEDADRDCLGLTPNQSPETAGSSEVLLTWDNIVDKSINPITGAKNFKGYRVWKAANWTRQSESVATESFQLLGDFSETADSSCVKLTALVPGGNPNDEDDYVTWDFCVASHEAFETYLDRLDGQLDGEVNRPQDSPCPVSVLENRPENTALFPSELRDKVFSKDIGSCPLGYIVDPGFRVEELRRQIEATTCQPRHLQVARLRPNCLYPDGSPCYEIADSLVATVCDTTWCKGFYRYLDRNVLPGYPYFYVVTAYSETMEEIGGENRLIELHTRPASSEANVIFPTTTADMGSVKNVTVVPNPYTGGAGWDLKPNPTDPTGTKIAFNHLPPQSTVRIFTLAGDMVQTLIPEEQDGGTHYWDLITRNGQDIVSGIYLYSVEAPMGSTVGKLVVIR